jgi:hypothetical protein
MRLATAAVALVLFAAPAATSAQVRVGVGVGVRTHRAVVRGYYAPFYSPFYSPFYYSPWYWGAPYWYPQGYYGYGSGYYGGASLRLQVSPKEAEVFIDGAYAGQVDNFDGIFQHLDLAPGEHDLELYLPGYRSVQQKVYLQPGNTFRVKYALEKLQPGEPEPARPTPPPQPAQTQAPLQVQPPRPLPNPGGGSPRGGIVVNRDAGYGTLALRVQPADAEILIDGERWTGAPAGQRLEVQLADGVHNVEVRRDGYRIYSTDVTVRGGETATLNVALTRQ